MADKSEELFQSIETIAKGLISDLKFNKTVICTIKDTKDAKEGKYYVTDGTSNFYAYCENTDYLIDQSVYVLIPNGDYSNQKIITGKYLASENEVYTYKSPLESFVDITGNLFKDATDLGAQDKSSLIANGTTKEIQLWSNENLAIKGYTTIGVRADFKTLLNDLNVVSGHYGIRIKIRFINDTTSQTKASSIIKQIEFNNEDMYGNTYNFETYYPQEKVFIIADPDKTIDKIWISFFQDADFGMASGALAPIAALDNLFVKNVYLAFGYDLNSFDSDKVLLYTLNSSTYDITSTIEENRKILNLRWIHKTDNNLEYYAEEKEEYSSQMCIHWYKYNLATGIKDDLAGNFWQEIQEAKNKFQYILDPDTKLSEEKIKVIIESPVVNEILNNIDDSELNAAASTLEVALAEYNDAQNSGNEERISNTSKIYDTALENYELIASKYSVEAQYYESNILTLTNESMVANYASIDLVNGLNIECDLDGYNGIYTIYNSANELQNQSEAGKLRLLTAVFDSIITGIESLDTAEKITWKFPLTQTMIQAPVNGKEYNTENGDEYTESSDGTYCLITRDGTKATGNIGSSFPNAANQYFRIKNYLVEQATNNTITCYVTKNNLTYSASINLSFGTSGTNGTDYTFMLQWEEGSNCIYSDEAYTNYGLDDESNFPIRIDAKLFDENNNELSINSVHFSWFNPGLTNTLRNSPITFCDATGQTQIDNNVPVLEINGTSYCYIHYDKNLTGEGYYNILKAEVTTEDNQEVKSNGEPLGFKVILTAYLPIPLCNNINITNFEGCNKILYNSLGTNPSYYTGAYKIFMGDEEQDSNWNISIADSQYDHTAIKSGDTDITLYYPQIESGEGENSKIYYYPIVPTMYFSATGISCAIGSYNNEIIWAQPILIQLDHYQSSMLNSWNGEFTINEETGSIMSTMIGAGQKDSRNRFSGVLVGDISEEDEGIFGYHEGDQSFGFRTNGQAFIGKAGKGRILFDGNSGAIQSMSYQEGISSLNMMTGMKIDLDDGVIEMHGVTSTAINGSDFRENPLSSTAINDSDFRRHGVYNLSSTAAYQPSHSLVRISSLSPYFYVAKAKNGYNQMIPLFQIGDKQSFIQTLDYEEGKKTGARITLNDLSGELEYDENGNIIIEDDQNNSKLKQSSFDIKAYSQTGGVKISSKPPYFVAQTKTTTATEYKTLLNVGNESFYLQSANYTPPINCSTSVSLDGETVLLDTSTVTTSSAIAGGQGMQIDLQTGKIIGYDFSLKAQENSGNYSGSYVSINSNGNSFLRIHLHANAAESYEIVKFTDQNPHASEDLGEEYRINNVAGYYLFNEDINEYEQITSGNNLIWDSSKTYYRKITTEERNLDLLNIGKNKFLLQSQDWISGSSGTQINLLNGKITSYNFNLKAIGDQGTIYINSNNRIYPFRIEGSQQITDGTIPEGTTTHIIVTNRGTSYFRVKWNGDFLVGNTNSHMHYENGDLKITGGSISGSDIEGSYIKGGELEIGSGNNGEESFFYVDKNSVDIGDWHVSYQSGSGGRQSFYYGSWDDAIVGMSGNPPSGRWYLWAGYGQRELPEHASAILTVNSGGVAAANLTTYGLTTINKVANTEHYSNVSLGAALDNIYDSIKDENGWNSWLVRNTPRTLPDHKVFCPRQ